MTTHSVLDALTLSTLEQCDRTMSAVARRALQEIVWRHKSLSLRHDCVFAKEVDVLHGAEQMKRRLAASLWRCEICGKMFESEHFLNKHLARKHPIVHVGSGAVCLADLCGVIVPCSRVGVAPSVSTALLLKRTTTTTTTNSPCSDKREFDNRKIACVHVVNNCVVANHDDDGRMKKYLHQHLCDAALAVECGRPVMKDVTLRSGNDGVNSADVIVVFVIALLAYTFFLLRRRVRRSSRYRLPTIWRKKSH